MRHLIQSGRISIAQKYKIDIKSFRGNIILILTLSINFNLQKNTIIKECDKIYVVTIKIIFKYHKYKEEHNLKDILQMINDDIALFIKEQEVRDRNIERLFKAYADESFDSLNEFKEKIKKGEITHVLFAGMGSSMYAMQETELKFLKHGIKAQTFEASKAAMLSETLIDEQTLLIVVSQSGTSPEVLDLVSKLDDSSNIITITNHKETPLGGFKHCFEMHADKEYYIAHNSYLNTLLLLDWIASYLTDEEKTISYEDVKSLLNTQDKYIKDNWDDLSKLFEDVDAVDFITHAFNSGTGYNSCLLFREGLGIMANTFTINEYYHGEHLVQNKNKLTIFVDVDPNKEDKEIMEKIEHINQHKSLFINYKDIYNDNDTQTYLNLKPVVQMALFNRIAEFMMEI